MVQKVNLNYPVPPVQPGNNQQKSNTSSKTAKTSFNEILQRQIGKEGKDAKEKIKFSGHCVKRMQQNNINISPAQLEKLENAVNKAELKGAKDSLVIMDDVALVVSIKNKTIITAVDSERMKDNVFTKIDSAVFV